MTDCAGRSLYEDSSGLNTLDKRRREGMRHVLHEPTELTMTVGLPCVSTGQRSDSNILRSLPDETSRRRQNEKQ